MARITLNERTADAVDVYAVGVLYELGFAYNLALRGMWTEARGRLDRIPGMWGRRNAWSGYLAEPIDSSRPFTRAGHAWSRRRALADLRRHMNTHSMQES
jgi:hypothetical protein